MMKLLTVGHSNLAYEVFLENLRLAGVETVIDVRSSPFSRYQPHFSRKSLEPALTRDGFGYAFHGGDLGGRPADPALFTNGRADYEKMAATPAFQNAVQIVAARAAREASVLMCAEKDPMDCHRCLLVSRAFAAHGFDVTHLLRDGSSIEHAEIEQTLIDRSGGEDLFSSREDRLADAYRARAMQVSYAAPSETPNAGPAR